MGQDDDSSDGEFASAVAVAAYAITSLEEEELKNKKRSAEGVRTSLTEPTSKKEVSAIKPINPGGIFGWFSAKEANDDRKSAVTGDSYMRKSEAAGQKMLEDSSINKQTDNRASTIPSIRRNPTPSGMHLSDKGSKKIESPVSTIKHTVSPGNDGKWDGKTTEFGTMETKADAWEKAEMDKIKKWYEKTNTTIFKWEEDKKAKSIRKMKRKEKKLELERASDFQEYQNEISIIEKISGGARAVAEERKQNDETKTREKAEKMRSTGKIPQRCFCF